VYLHTVRCLDYSSESPARDLLFPHELTGYSRACFWFSSLREQYNLRCYHPYFCSNRFKFRTKYQASGIGQTKSYSSSTCSTQQRSSGGGRRTYVSGSKFLSSGTHAKHISSDEKNGAVSFHKRKKVVAFSSHWQVGIGSQFLLGMPGAHVQSMPFLTLSKISEHVCDCTVSYTLLDDTEAGQCCGLLQ
jgi:hypothetical protein